MLPPDSANGEQNSNAPAETVRQLEAALADKQSAVEMCRERWYFFENAAEERLRVILRGDELLKARDKTISALEEECRQLRSEVDGLRKDAEALAARLAAEQVSAQSNPLETDRGMRELADRERRLTTENLELRNEGLLHSMIRRLRSIYD